MARSQLAPTSIDLQSDTGSVLWSLIQGEQLEFPITLNFLTNAGAGYTYEAVIVEAANVLGDTSIPTTFRVGGVETTLVVRVPPEKGNWAAATAYNREDVVLYNGIYYKLSSGVARVSATPPTSDVLWEVYVPNKVYIQFPKLLTLTPAYAVQPTNVSSVHGFFELAVTEPAGGVFQRTWKPMRGVVEILFSPTEQV